MSLGSTPPAIESGARLTAMPPRPEGLTLQNWIDAPFNRWGFWHVRELTRSARISRGTGPVTELPADPRPLDDLVIEHDGRSVTWEEWLAATQTDAIAIVREGRLVHEWTTEGYGPADTHLLMSCSKSLTSLCVGSLVADGLIDPQGAVVDHLPQLRGGSLEGATVQHVLDMRTGTAFNEEDYDDPMSDGRLIEEVSGYRPRTIDDLPADTAAWIATLGNDQEHGGPFRYRSILTDVLAWIVQEVTGRPFAEVFAERIWGPIGAERDADLIVDESGFPVVEGGISTTVRDFARVGLMCLQEGEIDGRRVLPAEWLRRLRARDPELIDAYAATQEVEPGFPDSCYHDQWWVADPAAGHFSGYGINGQQLLIHHPSQTVIAKFSTWPNGYIHRTSTLQDAGLLAVCESLES